MFNITVVGTGYVGLVTGACLADFGNRVTCVDIDASRIESLRAGELPFFEPGLPEMVARNVREERLLFSSDLVASLKGLEMQSPFGPIVWRAIDQQSTMGAYVGQLARKDGKGVMVNWRYADGAAFQPGDEEIRKLRKE